MKNEIQELKKKITDLEEVVQNQQKALQRHLECDKKETKELKEILISVKKALYGSNGTWQLAGKEIEERVETPMIIGEDARVVLTGEEIRVNPEPIAETEDEGTVLKKMASPIVQYLKNNHHPHTAIIVTERRVMAVETIHSIPNN